MMSEGNDHGNPAGDFAPRLQQAVTLVAVGALVFASAVGLWLACLLLWPRLGAWTAPLMYGRWMPLHLDLQLYGWCSLPAVGLLLFRLLPPSQPALRSAQWALALWGGALLAGALDWLAGDASGKLFLSWNGAARFAFFGAQLALWVVLAMGWLRRRHWDRGARRIVDLGILLGLLPVPLVLFLAARPDIYPPVNPDSGGATGHSLLASSLAVVGIAIALPALLGKRLVPFRRPTVAIVIVAYALNWIVYALVGHGNASNHSAGQVAALATLLAWPPLLRWWYRHFPWADPHRRWLVATAIWAGLLVVDGLVLFLPGVLEGAKFTNALVAHAHLAMAGLLTGLNMLMLISLAPESRLAVRLAAPGPWWWWNAGCLGMVAVLTALGAAEAGHPLLVPYGSGIAQLAYLLRLGFGGVMLGAALPWLRAAWHARARVVTASTTADAFSTTHLHHAG